MILSGKTIVVTGVASGIGAESAKSLKAAGARVIGVDPNEPAEHVDSFVHADLADPRSIDEAIESLPQGLNGLCNIAGVPPVLPPVQVLRVNCLGLKRLTYGLLPKMADGASITNIASLAGVGWPDATDAIKAFDAVGFDDVDDFCDRFGIVGARSYFFSKEYLIVWTFRHRWTWRDRGIRMNCVSPGPVETPILKDFLATLGARAEEDAKLMDRPGRPSDIAPVVTFLQSDGAAWFRGANLTADGGMSAHIALAQHGLLEG